MIVERRDHVLMTFLVPFSFCTSTFLSRWSSTKGPFFRLRGISVRLLVPAGVSSSALLASAPAAHDQGVARLALPRPALGLALRVDRVPTTGGLTLATTVRVVDRVHGDTADGRALALPPHAAGLAPVDIRLLGVAHLADGRAAAHIDVADLAGRHAQLSEAALACDQLDAGPGRAGDLRPAAGTELDGVNHRADRDVPQRQVVARLDVGRGAALDLVALAQPRRREDVALLAVGEVQQRDPRRAVRVVLDVRDLG